EALQIAEIAEIESIANAGTGEERMVESFAAKKERILKSDYYRWHVRLTGLAQGREYRYKIGGFEGSFRVPHESDVTRFLYLGDVQFQESMEEYEEWGQMVRRAYQEHPDLDFAVIGGDLVNSPGELPQWEAFLEACDVFAKLPLATVAGNHEGVHSNYTYQKLFALPDDAEEDQSGEEFYSLDFGNVRMLMMDSSFLTEERRQSMGKDAWVKEEQRVEAWIRSRTGSCEKPWLAAVIHHPVYGMHDEDTVSPQIRRLWAPLLETGGVRIVFSGHQHLYQRTRSIHGVVYLMGNSGQRESRFFHGNNLPEYTQQIYDRGANYQIVEAGARRLKMTSYNKKGLVIDETVLGRGLLFHIFEFFRSGQVIM
ncbi:MAG: metallophosphoesterase family protein, partial [Clostridia bacterium]